MLQGYNQEMNDKLDAYLKKYRLYQMTSVLISKISADFKWACPQEIYSSYLELKQSIEELIRELEPNKDLYDQVVSCVERTHNNMYTLIRSQEREPIGPRNPADMWAIEMLKKNLPIIKEELTISINWFE